MTTVTPTGRADVQPDLDTFRALARDYPVVPVTRRVLADGETPVGVFRKLAGGPGTFLLESAEHGRSWSRYSFVGVRSVATLTEAGGAARWLGDAPPGAPLTGNPLDVLRGTVAALRAPRLPGAPPLLGGLVGVLGYDIVRRLERVPEHAVDDLGLPELGVLVATDLAVLDHSDGSVLLVTNTFPADADAAYGAALERLDTMVAALATPAQPTVAAIDRSAEPHFRAATRPHDYQAAVARAQEEIRAGEIFQVVLSQRFETDTTATPLDIYRVLRATNPSPYMYLLHLPTPDGDVAVVGSSPESLVTVTGGQVRLHPIAGTRPRGATPEADAAAAADLLADPKERAEHVMLVDLGRNDLGRVCVPGSVRVVEFGAVERYSHVMHIVSTVVGRLAEPEPARRDTDSPDRAATALDALLAAFPAGTLSGAPKPRAMELIDELEPTRRGWYGGAVGYLDFAGDLDTAIAIRTAVLREPVDDGSARRAYVQAGAGIVADSDPATEEAECRHKAAAVLRAIALAESLTPLPVPASPAARRPSPPSAAAPHPAPESRATSGPLANPAPQGRVG